MRVGIAADHGGFEMKQELSKLLVNEGYEVVDFGNTVLDTNDDYPDFAVPLARAVASLEVDRGILLCGSGVGASVAANKVWGARAGLCHDDFSARQGVEDDDMNIICFGGRTMGIAVAWQCAKSFLAAKFSVQRGTLAGWQKLSLWMKFVFHANYGRQFRWNRNRRFA